MSQIRPSSSSSAAAAPLELISSRGLRDDGRRASEHRKIKCRMHYRTIADGSVLFEQGRTKVLAAVYGPRIWCVDGGYLRFCSFSFLDVPFISELVDDDATKFDRFQLLTRTLQRDHIKMTELRSILYSVVEYEIYPYKEIEIVVEILKDDGSAFAAAVTAASLALLDAKIRIRQIVTACTAAVYFSEDGEVYILTDLSLKEQSEIPFMTIAINYPTGVIASLTMTAEIHPAYYDAVVQATINGNRFVRLMLKHVTGSYLAASGGTSGVGKGSSNGICFKVNGP